MEKQNTHTQLLLFEILFFGGAPPAELPRPLWMRISLPRHDLLGEERLTSLSEEKGVKSLSQ